MPLFHFSEDPAIRVFEPRPVRIPVERGPGRNWLNGPLVWAIDGAHSPLYLFPRECPRILVWPTATTEAADRDRWFGERTCRAIAFIEAAWEQPVRAMTIYRYDLPAEGFEAIGEVGMWVSRTVVHPMGRSALDDLPRELAAENIELRIVPRLTPLRSLWQSSLHASGIRLRNAQDW